MSFEGLLSLRLSDHFALVVGCINNNWLNLWTKDACKVFTGISPSLCVGLLLSLTERFVYGPGAFFFFTWDVCCTHFTFVNKFLFVVQVWLNTLSLVVSFALPVCEMCCPFCTCIDILGAHAIFIFKTFWWFFGRNPLNGQILQCPQDEDRLLLGEQWSTYMHVLHNWSSVVHDVVQRVVVSVSSVLSKNSDVHERDLESCLQHCRRESLRQDVKLHDESASPPASESRRSRTLKTRKADGVLDRASWWVGRGRITLTSQ